MTTSVMTTSPWPSLIHRHNVVAERYGTLGDLRAELADGEHRRRHTTMREWLEAPSVDAERNLS